MACRYSPWIERPDIQRECMLAVQLPTINITDKNKHTYNTMMDCCHLDLVAQLPTYKQVINQSINPSNQSINKSISGV